MKWWKRRTLSHTNIDKGKKKICPNIINSCIFPIRWHSSEKLDSSFSFLLLALFHEYFQCSVWFDSISCLLSWYSNPFVYSAFSFCIHFSGPSQFYHKFRVLDRIIYWIRNSTLFYPVKYLFIIPKCLHKMNNEHT